MKKANKMIIKKPNNYKWIKKTNFLKYINSQKPKITQMNI